MATKTYKQIFKMSLILIMEFARNGRKPTLEDFKKFLQTEGISVIDLDGELFIIDCYGEAAAKISPHKRGGFQFTEL
jgi:hypothetical protein